VQTLESFGALGNSSPHDLGSPQRWECSNTLDLQPERRYVLDHLTHDPADAEDFQFIDLTQEQQRDVHAVRVGPFDAIAQRAAKLLLQRRPLVTNGLPNIDGDESADARHYSGSCA
jgi:hypothetical protein